MKGYYNHYRTMEISTDTHKIRDGAIDVLLVGDSHLRFHHHFPEAFEVAKGHENTVNKRFGVARRREDWEEPTSRFKKGFTFEPEYLEQLLGLAEERRGKATAIVISLGTNDIRDAANHDTVDALLESYKKLIQKVEETPAVVLYVVGPIPCDQGVDPFRQRFGDQLAALCFTHNRATRKVAYVDPLKRIPMMDGKYHRSELWDDELHLNKDGMWRVVEEFLVTIEQTSSELFLADHSIWIRKGHDSRHWTAHKKSQGPRKRGYSGGRTPMPISVPHSTPEFGNRKQKSIVWTPQGLQTAHGPGDQAVQGPSTIIKTRKGLRTSHGPGIEAVQGHTNFTREGVARREEVEEIRFPSRPTYTAVQKDKAWDRYYYERRALEEKFQLERERLQSKLLPVRFGFDPTEGCRDFREKRRRRNNDDDDRNGRGRSWATGANRVPVSSGRGGGKGYGHRR